MIDLNFLNGFFTERLILRKTIVRDALTLYNNIFNDYTYYKYYSPFYIDSFKTYQYIIDAVDNQNLVNNLISLTVCLKSTFEPIGIITIHTIDYQNKTCGLGYIISKRYSNYGYTTEAVKKTIEYILNFLNIHRIEAQIISTNIASIKVAQKCNFKYESTKKESCFLDGQFFNQEVYVIFNNKNHDN